MCPAYILFAAACFLLFLTFKGVALTFSFFYLLSFLLFIGIRDIASLSWVKPKEHKNDLAPNV
jgi:hypothetical protein